MRLLTRATTLLPLILAGLGVTSRPTHAQVTDADLNRVVTALLASYRGSEGEQQDTIRDKEVSPLDRDQLIHVLNTRRSSIQHAADALWPWSSEANRPIRKTFALPLNRAMGM